MVGLELQEVTGEEACSFWALLINIRSFVAHGATYAHKSFILVATGQLESKMLSPAGYPSPQ